ncbi:hypothetical protein [Chryseobacterium sp. WX]|uniref:hypothetical protein n=1 Tax=Chryseobacterium sp. WX TaxID=3031803 RepID=UPI00240A6ABD|nr:hypothetical protein [Chryseobacterium sp. WX]WFB67019.1 hypothetical protein PZ898_20245 [Chryseobacterium sp. WX]
MKTKLIILTAAAAVLLYSCSNDRDEEVRKDAIEKVKASNQNLKLNKPSLQSRDAESESIKDTIIIRNSNTVGTGITPTPEDGNEVVDPTKPDKPW